MPAEYTTEGRIKTAKPDGAGGFVSDIGAGTISGITVSALDGSIAHGNRVRIEVEASYAIGPKAQAEPRHWQMGSDIRVNGTQTGSETVGGAADTLTVWTSSDANLIISDSYLRHARVDRNYLMKYAAVASDPRAFANISPSDGSKYYQAFRCYPGHTYSSTRVYAISNVAGSFALDADLRRGELITIDTTNAIDQSEMTRTTGQAYIINVENGYIVYEQIDDFGSDIKLEGSTITGNSSGATATLGAYDASPHSVKGFRVEQQGRDSPGIRITHSHLSSGWFFMASTDSNGVQQSGDTYVSSYMQEPAPDSDPMNWHLMELVVDFSGSVGKVYFYTDGNLRYSNENYPLDYSSTVNGLRAKSIGLDSPGGGARGSMMVNGEFYMDNDTRRLYLCDAATLSESTGRELLRPESWTENADGSVVIDAALYQGAFGSMTNKYLALVENNTVIFEGVAI